MADIEFRTLHYGSDTFAIAEAEWPDVANRYAEKVRAGGDWVDVPTIRHGVVTLWAGPSIPTYFAASRKSKGTAIIV